MRKLILVAICSITHIQAYAQIWKFKDTLQKIPILQIGAGVFSGTHQFVPANQSTLYNNQLGYDRGILFEGLVNLTANWGLSVDYLIQQRSGYILFKNDIMEAGSFITAAGNQFRASLTYIIKNKKKKEILGVALGIARNRLLFDAEGPYGQAKLLGYEVVGSSYNTFKGQTFEYEAAVLKLSKTFNLYKRLQFVFFMENELQLNEYNILHGIRSRSNPTESIYSTSALKSNSLRIGCYFIF